MLNEVLKQHMIARGDRYTESIVEKTNSPNLAYKNPHDRARFEADYDFILSCQRAFARARNDRVA